ncbi:hypothetical protein [Streptomyces mirabilis]|uniref:hypothetical protein n=1 Tax=Streptomyces mirabilis TaxID=68239 RepID=UPI0036DA827A
MLPGLVVTVYRHAVIADDSRVLVTTGTGRGTALLCRRLGDERVTSVDVDPHLVKVAGERLDSVTPPPAEAGGFSLRRVGVATDQPGP